jgi:amino acid adenylation domain-containing protein
MNAEIPVEPPGLLHHLLRRSACLYPDSTALRDLTGRSITYRDLDSLSTRVQRYLHAIGLKRGDRVGICLRKTIDTVAVIFGILKAGCAYVPVDPSAPPNRSAQILTDCAVRALFIEDRYVAAVSVAMERALEQSGTVAVEALGCSILTLHDVGAGDGLKEGLDRWPQADASGVITTDGEQPDDPAYILYTSGSTGRPKGVTLTHRNAMSFVDWCMESFVPDERDCFSSHAPLHFDLSIFDLYVSIKSSAVLVLIDETTGRSPGLLADLIAREGITVWYSTPSVLTLLVQYGKLDQRVMSKLRLVLFAGEVFPIRHLRDLKALWPWPRYFNLYGPTETNVCTWYAIPERIPDDRTQPYPIGRACRHLRTMVVDPDGRRLGAGDEGELCVSGPAVMSGYWNRPERTEQCFLQAPDGGPWYRTGDVVIELPGGDYQFVGRRDRMVKRRGHRIELGEIEAALLRHPAIREVAVVVRNFKDGADFQLVAVLVGFSSEKLSIIALKRFCSEHLPASMIPDVFEVVEFLPKTSTDKIDYQELCDSTARKSCNPSAAT